MAHFDINIMDKCVYSCFTDIILILISRQQHIITSFGRWHQTNQPQSLSPLRAKFERHLIVGFVYSIWFKFKFAMSLTASLKFC